MIDTEATSEHPFQTFGDLGGQGDFGQEIEHLLAGLQRFLDEVDIDFGLATGGDPVKQADILLAEIIKDRGESFLLSRIQGVAS